MPVTASGGNHHAAARTSGRGGADGRRSRWNRTITPADMNRGGALHGLRSANEALLAGARVLVESTTAGSTGGACPARGSEGHARSASRTRSGLGARRARPDENHHARGYEPRRCPARAAKRRARDGHGILDALASANQGDSITVTFGPLESVAGVAPALFGLKNRGPAAGRHGQKGRAQGDKRAQTFTSVGGYAGG